MGIEYSIEKNGSLENYIKDCYENNVSMCFKGIEHFNLLKEKDILDSDSIIRIMYNSGRGDEHYRITEDFQLEGLDLNFHKGQLGIHSPESILLNDTPYYEVGIRWPKIKEILLS